MTTDFHPTSAQEQCLKVIWGLGEHDDDPVTVSRLAKALDQSNSAVSEMVKRLDEAGTVRHERYGAIHLTPKGRRVAVGMVRRHRLLETFLTAVLGYPWDEVHGEADALEHAVSNTLVDRIDAHLGHPTHDPHGDPIPAADGTLADTGTTRLADLAPGVVARVARVKDTDPQFLRFLSEKHITLGTSLARLPGEPYSADVVMSLPGREPITISARLARTIWVEPQA
ncbi:metal-dependent transcriptional regulator [Propionibacterium freudenreichii]|uniref:metal-dependent transcriptional regulator n=1 Tax=Propionibacterium freudenreichii TaxID=1744 RepID=UPI000542390F|nr:metal-dependent transcriptional regulator [Propionibacterium freudenreichii]MCT2990095.1 metal-dependent transcriptional regulator [Propionibacterium freudenreichii]MCT2993225.1 metal-dependent transcriptional regulator [Propionibacterium freudenreichii]MDK9331307.1 metal-dependent transcriptional regulator [Propionibacterium freudenreichii]MDK9650258.1 metal-dependent transcriptional regulator [Propionibacterium freudenreichii]MDK9658651.1 metal-dependent transcriptional regulator [Propion